MEKQRRIKILSLSAVIVAVLGLTVAFAALSTTLNIKGSAYLDAAKWGIKFQNLSEPSIVGEASDAKTAKIEKDVSINDIKVTLSKPGDSVTYTVDLVNDGDINAKIENIEKTNLTEEQQKYITFTVKYKENDTELKIGDILSKKEVKPLVIKIEYRKDLESSDLPKSAQGINLSYKLDFVQTDDKAVTTSGISKACTTFEKKDTYRVGDVIALCNNDTKVSEDFYVIRDNGSTVTALAKYNLLVGTTIDENFESKTISSSTEGYGLQNESAKGSRVTLTADGKVDFDSFPGIITGVLSFLNTNEIDSNKIDNCVASMEYCYHGYWGTADRGLNSKYGSSYPADVFDSNSNLYVPLKNYENYIKNTLNKTSVSTKLLTYNEAVSLGCNTNSSDGSMKICSSSNSWVYSTSYWLSTAESYAFLYAIAFAPEHGESVSKGQLYSGMYDSNLIGLRPVITISKSEL